MHSRITFSAGIATTVSPITGWTPGAVQELQYVVVTDWCFLHQKDSPEIQTFYIIWVTSYCIEKE